MSLLLVGMAEETDIEQYMSRCWQVRARTPESALASGKQRPKRTTPEVAMNGVGDGIMVGL
jgi:hypothetical protein